MVHTLLGTQAAFAIDLICADIDDTLDVARHSAGLQQNMCPICVVHCECQTVAKGVVHMSLQDQQSNCHECQQPAYDAAALQFALEDDDAPYATHAPT